MGVSVAAVAYYLPSREVSNEELLHMIRNKTDISQTALDHLKKELEKSKACTRYFKSQNDDSMTMTEIAARRCLEKANIPAQDLDFIFYGGMVREYLEPAMSVILQAQLGATKANAFDLANAGSGFLSMIDIASAYILAGKCDTILLVGTDIFSEWIPWESFGKENDKDCFSSLTVSDGAAAMLLQSGGPEKNFTLFDFKTLGQNHDLSKIKIGKGENDLKLTVQGKELTHVVQEVMSEFTPRFLEKTQNTLGNLDIWFTHQVTGEPREFFGPLDEEMYQKCYVSFPRVGNTGSVSLPLGMALAEEEGKLKRGDRVALVAGASGCSCGGTAFQY